MKKQKQIKPRLPMEAVLALRSKGGAHSTKRGKRGYDRKRTRKLLYV